MEVLYIYYSLVNLEIQPREVTNMPMFSYRGTICTIAITGSIVLGIHNPERYGLAAMSNLGTAIGGFFGAIEPRSSSTKEDN